jgi:hypothetical protein
MNGYCSVKNDYWYDMEEGGDVKKLNLNDQQYYDEIVVVRAVLIGGGSILVKLMVVTCYDVEGQTSIGVNQLNDWYCWCDRGDGIKAATMKWRTN